MKHQSRTNSPTINKKGLFTMRPLILTTLTAATLAFSALTPAAGHAATAKAQAARPACAVKFIIGHQTCYAPAQVAQAETRVPFAARPDAAVNLTFGLKLSQISIEVFPQSAKPARASEIDYFYGPLVKDYGRQGKSPIAIRIMESKTLADITKFRPAWTHTICGTKAEISPAADPQKLHPAYGPWYLIANFPHSHRSVGIVANTNKSMLETLACRLIQNQ